MTKQELEQCISEYGKDIYSFCRHLTYDQQEADDLYQDTFLKVIELQQKIAYKDQTKSYLIGIAIRIWKNRKRKYAWRNRIAAVERMVEERDEAVPEEWASSPEEAYISKEECLLVRDKVDALPEKLKLCVLLFYMEELSVGEIAHLLKVPEGTVKSRLYQARKRLEKELEDVL